MEILKEALNNIKNPHEIEIPYKIAIDDAGGFYLRLDLEEISKKAISMIQKTYPKKVSRNIINNNGNSTFKIVLFKFEKYKSYRAYCEKYGDEKGDEIVHMLKTIIVENLSEAETMAILDENTIATIIAKGHCKRVSETIINLFRKRIVEYYTKEDLEKGYIENINKHGEKKKYALIDICSERII